MAKTKRPHECDTQDPQRPCCWAARVAKLRDAGIYARLGESKDQQAERRAEAAAPALEARRIADAAIDGFSIRGID